MAIIGIDLGTTNSLAAVWRDGKSVLVPNSLGKYLTPSVVSINEDGNIITGETARQRLVSHPDKTASLFKQFMGSEKTYTLGKAKFKPEDLSAIILRSIKNDAETYLGEEIAEAIISVPAYFNDTQRSATKAAGQLAGLKVERIINEPSAAALAYRQLDLRNGTNLVFDFGGGTLDISVLEAFDNVVDILSVSGDNHLGGSDIDALVVSEFLREHPQLDGKLSKQQYGILQKTAEACKITLSDRKQVFMVYKHDEQEYSMVLDSEKLMRICSPVLVKFKDLIKRALLNAQLSLPMIDNIILIGGSCRMPLVQEYIKHLTNKPVLSDVDPDCAVAIGVGVAAGIKGRDEDIKDMVLTDICPFSLGVETRMGSKDGVFDAIIPRNNALPASRANTYTTLYDNQTFVKFKIYQGESIEAVKNLLLGECEVPVPPLPAREAQVTVRFTYDINGILDVEAQCIQSGSSAKKVIVGNKRLSECEIDKRLKELVKLKTPPRDSDENNLVIAQGQRLYEEFSGAVQAEIMARLIEFESAIEDGANPARIAMIRSRTGEYFQQLDRYIENLLFYGEAGDLNCDDLDEQ